MTHKTGLEDQYVIKHNQKLRMGYTTGSCAAAAAKAAATMLLGQRLVTHVNLMTPKGILLDLELEDIRLEEERVSCAIRKDGGDDPDMTNKALIYADVRRISEKEIRIDGGVGVGRVTKKGLEQPVGSAAINRVPRQMIKKELQAVLEEYQAAGGLEVIISVPNGEEIAKKTFNPRLGIVGGISILGTTGIVEPMSEAALIKSIEIEMDMRLAQGEEYLLITPGNYGAEYLRTQMDLPFEKNMKCSNYVGETVDMAVAKGVKGILFVAHIGKFIKVAGGIMNTHSWSADSRSELMTANALRAGISLDAAREMLNAGTTDEALCIAKREGVLEGMMQEITQRIQYYLEHRAFGRIPVGAILFSNEHGYLGETGNAKEIMKHFQ